MKVGEYIGRVNEGDVGIEIEVEGQNLPPGFGVWRRERDGSLRGEDSAEYVLIHPIPINEVNKQLTALRKAFDKYESTYANSPRAGVHVHINVQDLTFKQVMTMVCAYIILEELFIAFCDKSRDGNLFCLPSYNAEYLLWMIQEACHTDRIDNLNTDNVRYASINLKSLFKYGSIEFRALESTENFDKIELWTKMLYQLKESAKTFHDPQDLIMAFSMNDYVPTFQRIMGEHARHLAIKPNLPKVIRKGILRAQDIAFSRDWSSKNLNIFRKAAGVFA
jgi:hypothetical protein